MTTEVGKLGIIYSDDGFNPRPIREMLGLGGEVEQGDLPEAEKKRLANILWRTRNLTKGEVATIGGRLRKVED